MKVPISDITGKMQAVDDFYKGWQPLTAEDIANAIKWALDQPPHVNSNAIELMPTDQTYGGLAINKRTT